MSRPSRSPSSKFGVPRVTGLIPVSGPPHFLVTVEILLLLGNVLSKVSDYVKAGLGVLGCKIISHQTPYSR